MLFFPYLRSIVPQCCKRRVLVLCALYHKLGYCGLCQQCPVLSTAATTSKAFPVAVSGCNQDSRYHAVTCQLLAQLISHNKADNISQACSYHPAQARCQSASYRQQGKNQCGTYNHTCFSRSGLPTLPEGNQWPHSQPPATAQMVNTQQEQAVFTLRIVQNCRT